MIRFFDGYLSDWLRRPSRKPLIIRGQRQVGKTWAVRSLCEREERPLVEVNLEKFPELDAVFATNNVTKIISEIQAITNKKINEHSVLFFDEIQMAPRGLAALRYFYEEKPDLPVIATGSLLDFVFEDKKKFSMPVGRVEYAYLWPFCFEEFLIALSEEIALENLRRSDLLAIGNHAHESLVELFRYYCIVGGMPKSVATFAQRRDLAEVIAVQDDIVTSIVDDFGKYCGGKDLALMQRIFKSCARQVTKKVKYVNLDEHEKAKTVRTILELFFKARLLHPIYHSDANGIPLDAQTDSKIFKIIFSDIGLLCRILRLETPPRDSEIEGLLAEQFVGQELIAAAPRDCDIFYWLREKKKSNAELDYVFQKDRAILPVEVKSGSGGKLFSLHQFVYLKKLKGGTRFHAGLPAKEKLDVKVLDENGSHSINYELESYPLYDVRQWRLRYSGV